MKDMSDNTWILFGISGVKNDISNKYPTKIEVNIVMESIRILGVLMVNSVPRQQSKLPATKAYNLDKVSASTNSWNDRNIVLKSKRAKAVFKTTALLFMICKLLQLRIIH